MKYFLLLTIIALLPDVSFAANFVQCGDLGQDPCQACHFISMGNEILKWLIGIFFMIFAWVAAVAGFGLVTSGGNPAAKQAAKDKLVNALIGVVIVLAAWLLVDTIMRGLLSGGTGEIASQTTSYGLWSKIECAPPPVRPATGPGGGIAGVTVAECTNCTNLPSGIKIKATNGCAASVSPTGQCQLASYIVQDTANFQAAVESSGVAGARITEAWPPTGWTVATPNGIHSNSCHGRGDCFDYGKAEWGSTGYVDPDEVKVIIDAAVSNGLYPKFESGTPADIEKLFTGEKALPREYRKYMEEPLGSHITAPHFSIYGG